MSFSADFSEYEKEILSQVLDCRLKTRTFKTEAEAIASVKEFHKKILDASVQSKLSDEARITMDNMLVLEVYNYMYAENPKSEELGPFITAQYEKIQAFEETKDTENLNPWYVLSSGDLINSTMQFLPQKMAIKLGLKEKKDYDRVVQENETLGLGWINTALWYYFAPPIGGGNKDKAGRYFDNAVKNASSGYEKFYANIYLSQYKFEAQDKEAAEKYLSEADSVLPGNVYIPFIRRMNDTGYSLLFYSNNRERVDARMNKKYK